MSGSSSTSTIGSGGDDWDYYQRVLDWMTSFDHRNQGHEMDKFQESVGGDSLIDPDFSYREANTKPGTGRIARPAGEAMSLDEVTRGLEDLRMRRGLALVPGRLPGAASAELPVDQKLVAGGGGRGRGFRKAEREMRLREKEEANSTVFQRLAAQSVKDFFEDADGPESTPGSADGREDVVSHGAAREAKLKEDVAAELKSTTDKVNGGDPSPTMGPSSTSGFGTMSPNTTVPEENDDGVTGLAAIAAMVLDGKEKKKEIAEKPGVPNYPPPQVHARGVQGTRGRGKKIKFGPL